MTYTDAISAAVGAAYVDAQNRMLADAERRKCELLDDLLAKGAKVGDEESARAAGLSLDLDREYVVVVAVVTDSGRLEGDAALRLVEAAVLRSQPAFLPRPWAVVMRGALIAVIGCGDRGAAGATERIAPQVGQLMEREGLLVAVGVSATRSRLAEVAAGYDEALQAIRHATTERPTVAIEDIPLFDYLVAYGQESARRIVAPELVELATAKGSVAALAETALAYLDCGLNAERTAQRLYVHPNTVHYRLARLTELTGRDPHLPADLLEIVAAIRVVRQGGAPLGTVPKPAAADSESRPMTHGASAATLRHVRRLHSVGAGS